MTARRETLPAFFLLTFLVTWTSWIAAWPPSGGFRTIVFYLGVFAPGIVALGLTLWKDRAPGLWALLRRLVRWDVGLKYYVFALTFTAVIKLAVAVLHRVITGAWPQFGSEAWYLMLGATLVSTIMMGQAGEELGWRGYALPRMAARLGLGPASLLLGVIWAVWHLPLFYLPDAGLTGQSFPLYLAQVIGMSVILAWLYARTGGSLLLTMLAHAAFNNTKDIVPSSVPGATNPWALSPSLVGWLSVGLLWLCAGYFLTHMPGREALADSGGA